MKKIELPTETVSDGGDWDSEKVLRNVVLTLPFWRLNLERIDAALEIHQALDCDPKFPSISNDATKDLAEAMKMEGLQASFGPIFNRFYQRIMRAVMVAPVIKTPEPTKES